MARHTSTSMNMTKLARVAALESEQTQLTCMRSHLSPSHHRRQNSTSKGPYIAQITSDQRWRASGRPVASSISACRGSYLVCTLTWHDTLNFDIIWRRRLVRSTVMLGLSSPPASRASTKTELAASTSSCFTIHPPALMYQHCWLESDSIWIYFFLTKMRFIRVTIYRSPSTSNPTSVLL